MSQTRGQGPRLLPRRFVEVAAPRARRGHHGDRCDQCLDSGFCGGFTPFERLVSIRRGRGWFFVEFEAVRTASGPRPPSSRDSLRTVQKDQRPPTPSSDGHESARWRDGTARAAATPFHTQVAQAQKENKVEQKLKQVEQFWGVAVLKLARHKDTEVQVIVSPDDLIETLDEHNIQFQSPRAASCWSFTPSTRLVSISRWRGWFLF